MNNLEEKGQQGVRAFSESCENSREVFADTSTGSILPLCFLRVQAGLDKPWEAPSPESETAAEVVTTG